MRRRHHTFSTAKVTAAIALGVTIGGCAHATAASRSMGQGAVAAAGSWVSNVAARPVSVLESPTVSFALDRIDQRQPQLDNRYQRRGTGAGVTVYVFDGGVSSAHPELAGRVRRGFTAFPGDDAICNAHGTAVAGAVGGSTLGVAPEVDIVDVKMVECRRMRGTIQGIVEGAKWVLEDMARNPGRRAIANWSFVADTAASIPALDSAIASLNRAGVPVIVSAGNAPVNACRVSPGNAPGAIVVGASAIFHDRNGKPQDRRAHDTAYGPCIDIYAPGDSVMLPSIGDAHEPTTQLWNGTSMSAGYVSGAAALYLEAHPAATPDDVLAHLKRTATLNVVANARSPLTHLLYVGATQAQLPAAPAAIRVSSR